MSKNKNSKMHLFRDSNYSKKRLFHPRKQAYTDSVDIGAFVFLYAIIAFIIIAVVFLVV